MGMFLLAPFHSWCCWKITCRFDKWHLFFKEFVEDCLRRPIQGAAQEMLERVSAKKGSTKSPRIPVV